MAYYVIEYNEPPEGNGYMEIEDHNSPHRFRKWRIGRMDAQEPPDEKVIIDVVPYEKYNGLPPEMSDLVIPLMSARLRNAFLDAGVDNIVYHPVELRNTETKECYEYFAFKIVGLISAADVKTSDMISYDGNFIGDTSIFDLKLDESKTGDILIFRLAEKFSAIFVHESVRTIIESKGIDTIKFISPEDYYSI